MHCNAACHCALGFSLSAKHLQAVAAAGYTEQVALVLHDPFQLRGERPSGRTLGAVEAPWLLRLPHIIVQSV